MTMPRRLALALPCLALLAASSARAELRYVPIPFVGSGLLKVTVEYNRSDLGIRRVDVTKIPEGVAGSTVAPTHEQVYIGNSTSQTYPLLNITPGQPGLVVLDSQLGLTSDEVAMEAGKAPSNTAWELPLLTVSNSFAPGSTAFVQNLTKTADGSGSNLSIFNLGVSAASCSFKILRPMGSTLEERTGLVVPPIGAKRFDDALRRALNGSSGIVASVTCDQPFYSLGAFPSSDRSRVRVYYPTTAFPVAGTATTLVNNPGLVLSVVEGNSFLRIPVPLQTAPAGHGNGPRYRSLTMDFDVRTANPQGFTVIRNIVGFLRAGGRRFHKTLFFGNFDRLDANGGPKMILDIGTPYIEATVKRLLDLGGGRFVHFHIELNADQHLMLYQIYNTNGTAIFNVSSGLFNDDLNAVNTDVPNLEFGLPGVADSAYFPPFGWKFFNLKVVGKK